MFANQFNNTTTASLLATALLFTGGNAMSYEEPNYEVLYEEDGVEYRQYEPYLVSETLIESASDNDAAGDEGFRRLFRYISGGNNSQAKISMTVPVAQSASEKIEMTAPVQQSSSDSGWRVSFMLPSQYTLETAPVPSDKRVYVREVPGRLMAVRQFSGRWTESNYDKNAQKLESAVKSEQLEVLGEVERAAYNAPFSLPFLRRNEVMLPVAGLPAGATAEADATLVAY